MSSVGRSLLTCWMLFLLELRLVSLLLLFFKKKHAKFSPRVNWQRPARRWSFFFRLLSGCQIWAGERECARVVVGGWICYCFCVYVPRAFVCCSARGLGVSELGRIGFWSHQQPGPSGVAGAHSVRLGPVRYSRRWPRAGVLA